MDKKLQTELLVIKAMSEKVIERIDALIPPDSLNTKRPRRKHLSPQKAQEILYKRSLSRLR